MADGLGVNYVRFLLQEDKSKKLLDSIRKQKPTINSKKINLDKYFKRNDKNRSGVVEGDEYVFYVVSDNSIEIFWIFHIKGDSHCKQPDEFIMLMAYSRTHNFTKVIKNLVGPDGFYRCEV